MLIFKLSNGTAYSELHSQISINFLITPFFFTLIKLFCMYIIKYYLALILITVLCKSQIDFLPNKICRHSVLNCVKQSNILDI